MGGGLRLPAALNVVPVLLYPPPQKKMTKNISADIYMKKNTPGSTSTTVFFLYLIRNSAITSASHLIESYTTKRWKLRCSHCIVAKGQQFW